MLNLDQFAAEAIAEKLRISKIGVISKGLDSINPVNVAGIVSDLMNRELYVSIVGYTIEDFNSKMIISNKIEDAVNWRSNPDLSGQILIFVQDEVPKMRSLEDLDVVNSRDITQYLIKCVKNDKEVTTTQPQIRFWEALQKESSTLPLNLIVDFISNIMSDKSNLNSIPENLWRLGLLRDDALLNSNKDPVERIQRNRELLIEIGLLSEQSRKRLSSVLAHASSSERSRLQSSFINLKNFYRTGSKEILKQLDLPTVEELIRASKPKTSNTKKSKSADDKSKYQDDQDFDIENRPLKGKLLDKVIVKLTVEGSEESQQGLFELGETLRSHIMGGDQQGSNLVSIGPGFNDRTIQIENPDIEILSFIGQMCSEKHWGGVLKTNQETIRGIVTRFIPEDFDPFEPNNINKGISGQCLFSLLKHFDKTVIHSSSFESALNQLIDSRNILLKHIDLLVLQPFVLFGGYPEARNALEKYLAAYSDILTLFRKYDSDMHGYDSNALRFLATEMLRLEVIHIKTPTTWKAILTPLHPFHLWRYREILKSIHTEDRPLTREEKEQLSEALPELPHVVHFIVFSPDVSRNENVVLPLSGSINGLPTFENKTNRYLGNDGVEYLVDLLDKYEIDAPYSSTQIRIALVDVPDVITVMKILEDYLRKKKKSQIIVEAFFTRDQQSAGEMLKIEYEEKHHELAEFLKTGRIKIEFSYLNSLYEVCEAIKKRPVHIAFMFDQASYQINYAPRARQLLVSPLVISYEYEYSETFNRGTIAPSSEAEDGLFADYHFLVERAASLPAGEQLRLQYETFDGLAPINSLLSSDAVKWLAIADRSLTGYTPENAVLLSELYFGQREVAVWAKTSKRSIGQFIELLRRFNLRPNYDVVAELLRKFGHIASGGTLTLLTNAGNSQYREAQQKGYLGTVIAAAWYKQNYKEALIASLDSKLAKLWLTKRDDNVKRADLIGLRIDDDGCLIVEPIEVKTLAEGSETYVERNENGQVYLAGKAIEQLKSTLETLSPIFGDYENDPQPLFTPARREVLRYQLHRECFRDLHDNEWQVKWYRILKNAFSLPTPKVTVKLSGISINIRFEENTDKSVLSDEINSLTLVTLGAKAIQKIVSKNELGSDAPEDKEIESDDNVQKLSNIVVYERHNALNAITEQTVESILMQNINSQYTGRENANVAERQGDFSVEGTVPKIEEEGESEELARLFRRACQSYRISIEECDPSKAVVGPTVWRFFIKLGRGQRLDPLINSLEDIGREMRKSGLLVSQIPDSEYIALDIPRKDRQIISLKDGLSFLPRIKSPEEMPIVIGLTPESKCLIHDLGKMPHLLVGGTTGSGKTVFLYGLIISLLQTHPTPDTLRLMISTSKPEDFMFFEGLPHLETGEVISDAEEAIRLLESNIKETFDERLEILRESRCRDITEYNMVNPENPLPPLVVIIDEFADLADQLSVDRGAREVFYTNIRRIAQLGRSRGIHLVLCTQRPSRDLVPTNIRNLMNARVSLRVNDSTASRMILEEMGGEQLQKNGDLLFKDDRGLIRAQGYYISTSELVEFLSNITNSQKGKELID
jgi:hypothetical protein